MTLQVYYIEYINKMKEKEYYINREQNENNNNNNKNKITKNI